MGLKMAAPGAGIGSDDRGPDAELVGRAGLALADAFDLRRVEVIDAWKYGNTSRATEEA